MPPGSIGNKSRIVAMNPWPALARSRTCCRRPRAPRCCLRRAFGWHASTWRVAIQGAAEQACQQAIATGPYRAPVWAVCADISSSRGLADEARMRRSRADALRLPG